MWVFPGTKVPRRTLHQSSFQLWCSFSKIRSYCSTLLSTLMQVSSISSYFEKCLDDLLRNRAHYVFFGLLWPFNQTKVLLWQTCEVVFCLEAAGRQKQAAIPVFFLIGEMLTWLIRLVNDVAVLLQSVPLLEGAEGAEGVFMGFYAFVCL